MATAVRSRWLLTLVATLALAPGCTGSTDQAAVTTVAPDTTTATSGVPTTAVAITTTEVAAPMSDPPTTPATEPSTSLPRPESAMSITLLDPGAEPRVELRYRITPGIVTARLSQSQVLSQTIDGAAVPSPGDTGSVLEMSVETEPVAEGVRLTSEITSAVPNADVDPELSQTLGATLASLVGVRMVSVVDDRGLVLSSEVDQQSLAGVPDQVVAMMSSVADQAQGVTPLPAEPVGVGARWQFEQRLESAGIPITQTFEVTVISIDGDLVTLSSIGGQTVAPGPVQIPALPAGATAEVTNWQADITAEIVVDLTEPFPTSTLRSISRQSLLIDDGRQSVTLDQTIELEQRFELVG
jgi:hypothetical protein